VFRCDGTPQTGLGHSSRSLALAEAFIDRGYQCLFVGDFDPFVQNRLRGAEIAWENIDPTSWTSEDAGVLGQIARRVHAIGVVVDSYVVGSDYLALVERNGAPILLIDDFAALSHYPCSAVLNFTSRAPEFTYPCDRIRCYLGPTWFLARRSLRHIRAHGPRSTENARHVLVTSGGNDPIDVVVPAVEALLACDDSLSVRAVVRPNYDALNHLEALLSRFSGETSILTRLQDLTPELASADLCIANAGLTKYEAAYIGVPTGVLSQNDGQVKDAVKFAQLGMTIDLGAASDIDSARLTMQVSRLLTDREGRGKMQQECFVNFPLDPTARLVDAVLTDVFSGS